MAYTKGEMMTSFCKGAIWSCWSAGLRSWGNRLSESQQNNTSRHSVFISKAIQGGSLPFGVEEVQTLASSEVLPPAFPFGLGSAGETGQVREAVGTHCPWLSTKRLGRLSDSKGLLGTYCRKGQLLNQIYLVWAQKVHILGNSLVPAQLVTQQRTGWWAELANENSPKDNGHKTFNNRDV